MPDIRSETIALAALYQACHQINRVARTGYVDPYACTTLIRGLIITNPRTVDDIYAPAGLKNGFETLVEGMGGAGSVKTSETIEVSKMAFKIVGLELAIERDSDVFNRLGVQIDALRDAMLTRYPDYESGNPDHVLDPTCIRQFSSLYESLISSNFPRLIIYGEQTHLMQEQNQEMIRALLLAAIRAVVLWRQVGGRRRFLIFRRKAIVECARQGAV
ncbi:MAG TPA: DUF489 family protein [Candidatus Avisuccinivibrio pullicola]|nr:DUF489 family protein [Candidatus Avisuccinivibrio pullicola]